MKAGDIAGRHIFNDPGRHHDEEIDPHRIPGQLAQIADPHLFLDTGDGKNQLITELDPQRPGQPILNRSQALASLIRRKPAPGKQLIAGRHLGPPGEIEFPLNQPLRPLVLRITAGADRSPGNALQAAPDHRRQFRTDPGRRQHLRHRLPLLGLNVDNETVGGIDRYRLLPGIE